MAECKVCGNTYDDDTAVASSWVEESFCSVSCKIWFDTDYVISRSE